MGCLSLLALLCNIAVIFGIEIYVASYSISLAAWGLLGVVAWFLAYMVSVEASISPMDFWMNPEFDIAMKKLNFANCACGVVWMIIFFVAWICGNDVVLDLVNEIL
jgi:hypothetical protein